MDFLKVVLGEELFDQVAKAINEYNGNEANKDNQVKIANLSSGEYVGKGKFDSLEESLKGKQAELDSANGLIEQLKKGTKGNEELQGKITQYESTVADLQAQLAETKLKSAIKVALLSEKAVDVDYLTFKLNEKLKEKGETLELDENDNIKGWDALRDGLRTQFPSMFETASSDKYQVLGDGKLKQGEGGEALTRDALLKMPYSERMRIYNENPEAYNEAMKP
jgi:hypothetical protein